MMSLWDALRMNMMISYQELVRTFLSNIIIVHKHQIFARGVSRSQIPCSTPIVIRTTDNFPASRVKIILDEI
ncbi:hypothetical protein BK340_25950 [Escherichia coli]|nr:hypothetical protein BK340_25950 [Escherichia coli]